MDCSNRATKHRTIAPKGETPRPAAVRVKKDGSDFVPSIIRVKKDGSDSSPSPSPPKRTKHLASQAVLNTFTPKSDNTLAASLEGTVEPEKIQEVSTKPSAGFISENSGVQHHLCAQHNLYPSIWFPGPGQTPTPPWGNNGQYPVDTTAWQRQTMFDQDRKIEQLGRRVDELENLVSDLKDGLKKRFKALEKHQDKQTRQKRPRN